MLLCGVGCILATPVSNAQMSSPSTSDAIRPFRISIPEQAVVELRQRVRATRWPDKETVPDRSQGIQLRSLQGLVRYWGTDYDWRKVEAGIC